MLIVVLGGGISLEGEIPPYVYKRLDKAVSLHKRYPGAKIVVAGRYSFLYKEKKPSTTEAKVMAQYLYRKDIAKEDIILEEESQDTIGNAYFLKKDVFLPRGEKKGVIVTSDFHNKRAEYVFEKIFGPSYDLRFIAAESGFSKDTAKRVVKRQQETLERTKKLMVKMKRGNHKFFEKKLYKMDYWKQGRPEWVKKFVREGK